MRCWNCDHQSYHAECLQCGQPVKPDRAQAREAAAKVDYLLGEIKRWDWLEDERAQELSSTYQGRRKSLLSLGLPRPSQKLQATPEILEFGLEEINSSAPVDNRAAEPVAAAAEPVAARSKPIDDPNALTQAPAIEAGALVPTAREPGWGQLLANFLEEKNVRWFHTLGALLLLSAGVGYLRSQWDGAGRQLVALLMTVSPVVFFGLARKLRDQLPLSSRLLCVLAGMLLPTGMLALNHFGVAGLHLDYHLWAAFSFAVTATVLLWQANVLKELICLYLGSLSLVLVGHSLGTLAGNAPLVMGMFSFICGGFFLWVATEERPWRKHYQLLCQLLGLAGLAASAPRLLVGSDATAVALFLAGSLFFAAAGFILKEARALWGSAIFGAFGSFFLSWILELPSQSVGFALLLLSGVFLAGSKFADEEELKQNSQLLSGLFGAPLLALVMASQLLHHLLDNFHQLHNTELFTSALLGLAAAGYYALACLLNRQPSLLYASALTGTYASLMLAVLVSGRQPQYYPLLLLLFPALLLALGWRLRLSPDFAAPVRHSVLTLTPLLATVCGCFQMAGVMTTPMAALTYLSGTALLTALAVWCRNPGPLYLAGICLTSAYATLTQPHALLADWPLVFAPLVGGLAFTADRLKQPWKDTVASSTLVLALGLVSLELVTLQASAGNFITLLLYSAGFAWASTRFAQAEAQAHPQLQLLSALLWPAMAVALMGWNDSGAGMLWCLALLMVALGELLGQGGWKNAARSSALLWSGLLPFITAHEWLVLGPVAVWLLAALTDVAGEDGRPTQLLGCGRGAFAFLLIGFPQCSWESLLAVSAMAVVAYVYSAQRHQEPGLVFTGWFSAGLAWMSLLELLNIHGDSYFCSWWLFNLVIWLPALLLHKDDNDPCRPVWERYALLTAALVLITSCEQWTVLGALCQLLYAGVFIGIAVWRRSTGMLMVSQGLLVLGGLGMVKHLEFDQQAGPIYLALLALGQAAVAARKPEFEKMLAAFSLVLATVAALNGLGHGPEVLWVAFIAFTGRALLGLGRFNHLPAFLCAYTAYLWMLHDAGISNLEMKTTPLALWLLGWAYLLEREGKTEQATQGYALGQAALLTLPLLASVNGLGHAIFVALAAVALMLVGMGLPCRQLMVGGTLALLAEMLIRAAKVGAMLPWQLTAALVGLALVGLGIAVERKMLSFEKVYRWIGDSSDSPSPL